MIDKQLLKKHANELTSDKQDYMNAFRRNLYKYVDDKKITLNDIIDDSGINLSTLKTLLYRGSEDIMLSNAVKLARALAISVDELIGSETIPSDTAESLRMCRNLPENDLYLIRWFIRYLYTLNQKVDSNKRFVSVMIPNIDNSGNIMIASEYEKVQIKTIEEPNKSKVFFGVRIMCDNYMPHYLPNDIVLIANDRPPKFTEHVLLRSDKYLYIAKQNIESGQGKFFSIRDGKYRLALSDIDELVGYVAAIIRAG